MHQQISFGHDALGRFLGDRLQRAMEWALESFTREGVDLDACMAEAKRTHGVAVPEILIDALWVEYQPAGNGRNVRHSEPDRVVVHIPLSGTAEIVDRLGREGRHDGPKVQGDELVVAESLQLTYFPERALNADAARADGEALRSRALRAAEERVAEAKARSGEIERYNAALEAALTAQRAKVENCLRYRAELEAGIGLPTARPRGDDAGEASGAEVA